MALKKTIVLTDTIENANGDEIAEMQTYLTGMVAHLSLGRWDYQSRLVILMMAGLFCLSKMIRLSRNVNRNLWQQPSGSKKHCVKRMVSIRH